MSSSAVAGPVLAADTLAFELPCVAPSNQVARAAFAAKCEAVVRAILALPPEDGGDEFEVSVWSSTGAGTTGFVRVCITPRHTEGAARNEAIAALAHMLVPQDGRASAAAYAPVVGTADVPSSRTCMRLPTAPGGAAMFFGLPETLRRMGADRLTWLNVHYTAPDLMEPGLQRVGGVPETLPGQRQQQAAPQGPPQQTGMWDDLVRAGAAVPPSTAEPLRGGTAIMTTAAVTLSRDADERPSPPTAPPTHTPEATERFAIAGIKAVRDLERQLATPAGGLDEPRGGPVAADRKKLTLLSMPPEVPVRVDVFVECMRRDDEPWDGDEPPTGAAWTINTLQQALSSTRVFTAYRTTVQVFTLTAPPHSQFSRPEGASMMGRHAVLHVAQAAQTWADDEGIYQCPGHCPSLEIVPSVITLHPSTVVPVETVARAEEQFLSTKAVLEANDEAGARKYSGGEGVTLSVLPGTFEATGTRGEDDQLRVLTYNVKHGGGSGADRVPPRQATRVFSVEHVKRLQPRRSILLTMTCNEVERKAACGGRRFCLEHLTPEGSWRTEDSDVFFSYSPDAAQCCRELCATLCHFSIFRFILVPEGVDLSGRIDDRHSREWDASEIDTKFTRGGKPYYVPVGFAGTGLTSEKFDTRSHNVAFHGTSPSSAVTIVTTSFQLPVNVRPGHIPLSTTVHGIPNFAEAIFATPSYRLAACYGKTKLATNAKSGVTWIAAEHIKEGGFLIVLLQCRLDPGSFTEHPNTIATTPGVKWADPHYDNATIEWRVANPTNIVPYRLLEMKVPLADFVDTFKNCNFPKAPSPAKAEAPTKGA